MKHEMVHRIAAVIFLAVAIMHLLRLINHWEAIFNGWMVPMWVSVVGLIVAGYLGVHLWTDSHGK